MEMEMEMIVWGLFYVARSYPCRATLDSRRGLLLKAPRLAALVRRFS
jgi:hypothetical protein